MLNSTWWKLALCVALSAVTIINADMASGDTVPEVFEELEPKQSTDEQPKDPSIKVIHARGNQIFSRQTLTEGPSDSRDSFDSLEAYFPVSIPKSYKWVVGWKPRVTKHKAPCGDVELPHHLNILVGHDMDARFLATYDRGAKAFHFPKDPQSGKPMYGIPVGSEPARLEYHLLVPKCWDFKKNPSVVEDSGFDLYVTNVAPKFGAAIFGGMDQRMRIKPGNGKVDHVTHISSKMLETMFKPSAVQWPKDVPRVELLAVHMHTHEIFDKKFFEVLRSDASSKFRSKPEATGYGASQQSMLTMKQKGWPTLHLEKGDVINQHCLVDTSHLDQTLEDGTSWGNEMCAPMFIVGGKGIETAPSQLTMESGYTVKVSLQ